MDTNTAVSMIPYVGIFSALTRPKAPKMDDSPVSEPKNLQVTMFLKSLDEKSTEVRFKMQIDGEPAWDPTTIDKIWVATEREAMIEEGPIAAPVASKEEPVVQIISASPALQAETATSAQPAINPPVADKALDVPPSTQTDKPSPDATSEAKTAQPATTQSAVVYVKDPAIILWNRQGTQPTGTVILPQGTRLTVLGQEDKWYHVKTDDGTEGWVVSESTSSQP